VSRNPYGLERISMEQMLLYDPDVILVLDKVFYQKVFKDPIW
jgi:iron complex transport system substrate-binding protein